MRRVVWVTLFAIGFAVSACIGTPTAPAVTSAPATALATAAPTVTSLPATAAATAAPAVTSTPQPPAATAAPTLAPAASSTPGSTTTGGTGSAYLDDRSDGPAVMRSFVNALNTKEYARAYSYWETGAPQLLPFSQFQQGYAGTAAVQLSLGTPGLGAAAGNLYWNVPAVLIATTTSGATQTFAGCYSLHLGQPASQGVPPFQPLAIQRAFVKQAANGTSIPSLLASACQGPDIPGGPPITVTPAPAPGDISASRYLDDRSDAVQVVRSIFNAINRHEYVRAYSYWESGAAASQLPPFPQFQAGYTGTESVTLATGTVRPGTGAGQLYYQVPVVLVVQSMSGGTQTFAGCYTMHLARPEIQTAPPYQPMGVNSANMRQVPNGSDTTALLASACP